LGLAVGAGDPGAWQRHQAGNPELRCRIIRVLQLRP
jgi:hypothetical protein